jgi:methionine-rich copper-binding protein CopC
VGDRNRGRLATLRASAVGVVAAVLAALVSPGVAAAHNSLISSNPKNGATVARPPAAVRLTFLARLDPATTKVTVTGPDGATAAAGAPTFTGKTVTVSLRAGAAGRYTVAYQVASSDGHPIKGTVRFTATTGNAPTATATPSTPTPSPTAPPTSPAPDATAPSLSPAAGEGTAGGTGWWWLAGLAVVLALLAGALAWRRRSRAA